MINLDTYTTTFRNRNKEAAVGHKTTESKAATAVTYQVEEDLYD